MPLRRPQFRLRSLFILTAIVAVACIVGPPIFTALYDYVYPPKTTPIRQWLRKSRAQPVQESSTAR
jgi:hypothetical protein